MREKKKEEEEEEEEDWWLPEKVRRKNACGNGP
jgi:hypothetical protein